jgi:hypothetical protein
MEILTLLQCKTGFKNKITYSLHLCSNETPKHAQNGFINCHNSVQYVGLFILSAVYPAGIKFSGNEVMFVMNAFVFKPLSYAFQMLLHIYVIDWQ